MKSLNETLREVIDRFPIDSQKSRKGFILDLLCNDGNFSREELTEIDVALSLLTNEELGEIERKFHNSVNTLEIAVELVALIRRRYGNIF